MGRDKAHGNRQRKQVNWISKRYPKAWQQADAWRCEKDQWPTWCFMPMEHWYAIAREVWPSGEANIANIADVGRLAALGAWRITQGIYRFDPDLYAALISTPLTGDLPDDLLYRLPEWCVYVETPGLSFAEQPLLGVYAHMEYDARDGHADLRLVFDSEKTDLHLFPQPIRLVRGSLLASIKATTDFARQTMERFYPDKLKAFEDVAPEQDTHDLTPIISLLLYLCADEADYERPSRPRTVRTQKHGRLMPPPENARYWDVGTRIGAALRTARDTAAHSDADLPEPSDRAKPRPHWRRAHWHTFWSGPLDAERTARVQWLPPIAVNVNHPDLPTVIHPVTP